MGNKESPFIWDLEYSIRQIKRKYITENNWQNQNLYHLICPPFTGMLRLLIFPECSNPQPCYWMFTPDEHPHMTPVLFYLKG